MYFPKALDSVNSEHSMLNFTYYSKVSTSGV